MTSTYWNGAHTERYSKSDWAFKPSIFAKEVVNFFPKQGKILDIGTGQGGDADFFQSLGYEVVATDYADEAISSSSKRVQNVSFHNVDTANGLPFADSAFDVVYSHMALHYFDAETTKKIFLDIHRVLKPAGVFATITNTIDDPEKEEDGYKKIEDGYYQDPQGITKRYFSVQSFSSFASSLFEVVMLDDKGTTYKDDIETLIRFVGKKKIYETTT